jgi:hypothetical protein
MNITVYAGLGLQNGNVRICHLQLRNPFNILLKGAELKGLSREEENGKTVYEVETIKNGKTFKIAVTAAGLIVKQEVVFHM